MTQDMEKTLLEPELEAGWDYHTAYSMALNIYSKEIETSLFNIWTYLLYALLVYITLKSAVYIKVEVYNNIFRKTGFFPLKYPEHEVVFCHFRKCNF